MPGRRPGSRQHAKGRQLRLSIRKLGREFRDRALSPERLVADLLSEIARRDGALHSFFSVTPESAIQESARATQQLAAGNDRGALHGIPYAVADVFDVAGLPTTCGSRLRRGHIARNDAGIVARLRAAGAVLIGKCAVFEFATGAPGPDSLYPAARNPWDEARTPGATGAGAALAAGFVALAIASDTGGAVRGSAAMCGVTGLKPTAGGFDMTGVEPLSPTLDHLGLLAVSADDLAIAWQTLGSDAPGPRDHEPISAGQLRVGILAGMPGITPGMSAAIERAADEFRRAGAAVDTFSNELTEKLFAAGQIIYAAESHAIHRDDLRRRPQLYGEATRTRLSSGATVTAGDLANARAAATALSAQFDAQVMSRHDVLLAPAAAGPAPVVAASSYGAAGRSGSLTLPFNVTGHPALSIPCGMENGVPLGLQMIGQRGEETTLLRAAAMCETKFA